LSIANFAIIERTTIRFDAGLNVLTGETGAGKSILLDALGAVLGQRVSSDLVRTGAKAAQIEALFQPAPDVLARLAPTFEELGIEIDEDGTIVVARDILAGGRSTARLNGRLVTASALNAVGAALVDIHGQSDHLAILKTTEQRAMLDRFAGLDERRALLAGKVRAWRQVRQRIRDLSTNDREREQRIDLLRYQVDEIDEAALTVGEDEELAREREVLQNADRLRHDAALAIAAIAGDDTASDAPSASMLLRSVERSMQDLAQIDAASQGLAERATDLVVLAEDLARDLGSYLDAVQLDPQRLAEVEDRLALIQSLRRKYGATIEDILAYGDDARGELDQLGGAAFDIDALHSEEASLARELAALAADLSQRRAKAAAILSKRIAQSIAELRMGRSELFIRVQQRPDADGIPLHEGGEPVHIDESGADDVEFLIAPDAGETLRPLARIASGGETARIMLALKSILSDVDETPTLVFDEIDVGVGGRSGQVVGEKLWSLTGHHQVIVITHLPQIAAFANQHLRIAKQDRNGRVVSTVIEIHDDERLDELAAMLDGTPVTAASRASAEEMVRRSDDAMQRMVALATAGSSAA
ncbi:MAG: DNA repair protein RecN, partial [Thermomicrobiales bacterium]